MFKNKVVLITGGSAGIGEATAEQFAKEGATVVIVGRNEDRLKEVGQRCNKYGVQTLTIKADLSKDEETDTVVKQTIDEFGKLDVLVNNAGIFREVHITDDNFLDTFDEVMNTNIRGTVRITRHAVPHIITSKGNIVNVSSIAGIHTKKPKSLPYKTSKAALTHFSRSCAAELAQYGVRVNSISPGPVNTSIFEGPLGANVLKSCTALSRVSESEEVADLILYVASDKAKGITGSDFLIDNGRLLM